MNEGLLRELLSAATAGGLSEAALERCLELHDLLDHEDVKLAHLDLLDACTSFPLAAQVPDTLKANVIHSAQLMGVGKEAFVTAALKQPPLFCQSPDTLNGNMTRSAELLGLSKEAIVKWNGTRHCCASHASEEDDRARQTQGQDLGVAVAGFPGNRTAEEGSAAREQGLRRGLSA